MEYADNHNDRRLYRMIRDPRIFGNENIVE